MPEQQDPRLPPERHEGHSPTGRRPRRGLLGSVTSSAGGLVQSVANRVAPGVVGALDVDEIVQRTDVQAVVDRIDVQDLMERVDLNSLLERVDVDALLDRVDVDHVLDRVDINRLLDRVDVARLVDRVDVNAVAGRIDLQALVEQTELAGIIVHSTAGVTGQLLDLVRSQGVGLDDTAHQWIDRLLRGGRQPPVGGPPLLATHAYPDP